jgi:4-amino-4-deoxy-L-arabinose transferase-like glycosyltransferase
VLQLIAGNGWGIALLTAVLGFAVAFVVLWVSDRFFERRGS